MNKTSPTLEQMYYIVLPLIRRAGQMLVSRQKGIANLSDKERHEREQKTEEEIISFLRTTLNRLFPNHKVHGQDREPEGESDAAYEWIVQHLDGRRYYGRGLPLYTCSIALKKNGEVVLGIVFEPVTDTVYHALKGNGAAVDNRNIRVSDQKDFPESAVYLESPAGANERDQKSRAEVWQSFTKAGCRMYDLGVPSLGLCYVAAGAFDVLVGGLEHEAFAIDYAAALLIADEAGANVTDAQGKSLPSDHSPALVVVATPPVHKKSLTLLERK